MKETIKAIQTPRNLAEYIYLTCPLVPKEPSSKHSQDLDIGAHTFLLKLLQIKNRFFHCNEINYFLERKIYPFLMTFSSNPFSYHPPAP